MKAHYFAFGVNHEAAGVSVREPFELSDEQVGRMVESVRGAVSCDWILLATCNRTEVYGFGTVMDVEALRLALTEIAGTPWPLADSFDVRGREAVRHVVEVTAGLRSQVLGDIQVLNQIKVAYRRAHGYETVGTPLHKLLHAALASAKRIATETAVYQGNPSIGSLATRLARRLVSGRRFANAENPVRVLVLGAGQMGAKIARILSHDQVVQLQVSNRSLARAERLQVTCGASVVPWAQRQEAVKDMDVVFVTTASRSHVLDASSMPPRPDHPVLVVDVAVPRNADPSLASIEGYQVLDLDAMKEIGRDERKEQEHGLGTALGICNEAIMEVMAWKREQDLIKPAVQVLADAFEQVREQVVTRNLHRFDEQHQEQVHRLTRSLMQKLLAIPVVRLKASGVADDAVAEQVSMLARLFAREACEE